MFQEELRCFLGRFFPFLSRIVKEELGHGPEGLNCCFERPVLTTPSGITVPATVWQLLADKPVNGFPDPIVPGKAEFCQCSYHVARCTNVRLELVRTFGAQSETACFYIVKLEEVFYRVLNALV